MEAARRIRQATTPAPLRLLLTCAAALALAGIVVAVATLFVRAPLNSNEGWVALHALRFASGANPYAPNLYSNFLNYPPLYFHLLAAMGEVLGDHIYIGRAISLGSMLAIAVSIGFAAKAMGARAEAAIFGGVFFLAFSFANMPNYAAVNDPQYFAHAVATLALVALLSRPAVALDRRTVVAACVVMVAASFVKHNLVGLPLASTWYLYRHRRDLLFAWLATGAAALTAGLAACALAFGSEFFLMVFGHRRIYSLAGLLTGLARLLPHLPIVALAIFAAREARDEARTEFLLIYLVLSAAAGLLFMGGRGVAGNVFFDVTIASACLLTLATPSWRGTVALFATFALIIGFGWNGYLARLKSRGTAEGLDPVIAALAAAPGTVACEDQALCYWAGRQSEIDFSNLAHPLRLDPAYEVAFADWLADAPLALIATRPTASGRLTERAAAALAGAYRRVGSGTATLYFPEY